MAAADQTNYYAFLRVAPDASAEDIRRAYRTLAKTVHPDTSAESDATRQFQLLQVAYQTLSDPRARALYDAQQAARAAAHNAFALRLAASHAALEARTEPQALYVLAEIAATGKPRARPGINLCLVLDRSLSMEGERLRRAQEAACYLIDQLGPTDVISAVAFGDRARVVLDGSVNPDRHVARENIRAIHALGGTELLQGLNLGLEQVRKWRTPGSINHLILLTDGNTYGDEAGCIEAAARAGQEQIGLTLLGLGSEWNDALLDEMAARSNGYSFFVDSPDKLTEVFRARFATVENLAARDLRVVLHSHPSVRVQALYRLTPDISRLALDDNSAPLGVLEHGRPLRLLVELLVQAASPGPLRALRVSVDGERLQEAATSEMRTEQSRNLVDADVEASIVAESPAAAVPPDLDAALARLAAFKVQEKAISEVERGDHRRATARLQNLATHLKSFGEEELARAALLEAGELARTGQLTAEGRKRIRYGTKQLGNTAPSGAPSK